jgi:acetyl-CoA synthetase
MTAELYPVPADFAANTRINRDEYQHLYAQSMQDPDVFWMQQAARLDWVRVPTQGKDVSFDLHDFHIRWFADGQLNVAIWTRAATRPR